MTINSGNGNKCGETAASLQFYVEKPGDDVDKIAKEIE